MIRGRHLVAHQRQCHYRAELPASRSEKHLLTGRLWRGSGPRVRTSERPLQHETAHSVRNPRPSAESVYRRRVALPGWHWPLHCGQRLSTGGSPPPHPGCLWRIIPYFPDVKAGCEAHSIGLNQITVSITTCETVVADVDIQGMAETGPTSSRRMADVVSGRET